MSVFHKYQYFRNLKLEIALAIPSSNECKIEKVSGQMLTLRLTLIFVIYIEMRIAAATRISM